MVLDCVGISVHRHSVNEGRLGLYCILARFVLNFHFLKGLELSLKLFVLKSELLHQNLFLNCYLIVCLLTHLMLFLFCFFDLVTSYI